MSSLLGPDVSHVVCAGDGQLPQVVVLQAALTACVW